MADELFDKYGVQPQGEPGSANNPSEIPKVSTKAEIDALAPGAEFLDPTGTKRTKPYRVSDANSYRQVPEGGTFLDPTGTARTKPTYEALDYWPQTLIEAARGNERQIEAILHGEYGAENVKREPLTNDFYVEKDGKKYKPGKTSVKTALASLTANAAPVGLSTAGAVLGGTAGSPSTRAFSVWRAIPRPWRSTPRRSAGRPCTPAARRPAVPLSARASAPLRMPRAG
jgi:hypothetical protein